jgi:hypothetical protein
MKFQFKILNVFITVQKINIQVNDPLNIYKISVIVICEDVSQLLCQRP